MVEKLVARLVRFVDQRIRKMPYFAGSGASQHTVLRADRAGPGMAKIKPRHRQAPLFTVLENAWAGSTAPLPAPARVHFGGKMAQQAILVVDDEAPMRKFVSHNLRAGGYNVLTAADGSEALKVASEHPLDLLLLDIGLPGPDGLAVLEAVRRDMQVPVLMISARGREADRVRALDLGADDYLTKPFGVAELLARVRALLRRVTPGPKGPLPSYHYQDLEVDFVAGRARMQGSDVPLTHRGLEVLAYLAR